MIEAGNLRHRVTLVLCERHDNGSGGSRTIWRDGATVWAEVLPIRGSERIQAEAQESEITHRVRIRKGSAPTLAPEDRLRIGNRTFHISSLYDYGERGEFWEIQAEERKR